jgi:hypothetical protein
MQMALGMFYAYFSPFLVYFALLSFLVASIIQGYTLLNHTRVASANSGVSRRQVRFVTPSCHGGYSKDIVCQPCSSLQH